MNSQGDCLRKLSFKVDFFVKLDLPDVFCIRINRYKTVKNDQNGEKNGKMDYIPL